MIARGTGRPDYFQVWMELKSLPVQNVPRFGSKLRRVTESQFFVSYSSVLGLEPLTQSEVPRSSGWVWFQICLVRVRHSKHPCARGASSDHRGLHHPRRSLGSLGHALLQLVDGHGKHRHQVILESARCEARATTE